MTKYTCTNCGAEITVETTRDDVIEAQDHAVRNAINYMSEIELSHAFDCHDDINAASESFREALRRKIDNKFNELLSMKLNSIRREKAEKKGWAFFRDRTWCVKCFNEMENAFMSNPLVAIPFLDNIGYLINKDGERFNKMLWRLHKKYNADDDE